MRMCLLVSRVRLNDWDEVQVRWGIRTALVDYEQTVRSYDSR
jgi:hypothetical protein